MMISATAGSRTGQLLDWATRASLQDLPLATQEFAKGLILKTVATMVIGAREPFGRQLVSYGARTAGVREASVVGGGYRTSLESAALINGTLAHQTESEDNFFTRDTREAASTCWTFPAILSAAELHQASGQKVLLACTVAFELASRMVVASPGLGSVHGICTCTWFGSPATAAGVGLLMGLDARRLGHAMSIAFSQSAGLGLQTGTDAHKLEAGHACRAGVLSAILAADGAVGAPDFLDSGLAFAPVAPDGRLRLDALTDHLGEPPFYLDQIEYKKYPACGLVHASVDGLADMMRAEGLSVDDVESVAVEVAPIAVQYCDRPLPDTIDQARFSFSFALAAVLLDGRVGYDSYSPEALVDPVRREVQGRISVVGNGDQPPKDNGARLSMVLRDGRTLAWEVNGFLGHPSSPISPPEMVALLRQDLEPYLDGPSIDYLVDQIMQLDSQSSLTPLFDLLREVNHGGS